MEQQTENEALIVRYLLGELSEEEQVRIEEQFFADDEYFELMSAVEYELIDDYVNGELTERERQQFEKHFLASPKHRQRVEYAKALMKSASATEVVEMALPSEVRPEPVTWRQSLIAFWRAQSLATRFSLAASILLVVGGSWLIIETVRLRNQVEHLQAERTELQQREQELQQQLAQQQNPGNVSVGVPHSAQLQTERQAWLRREQELQQQVTDQRARNDEVAKQLEQAQNERNRREQEFQQQIAEQRQRIDELAKLVGQERDERNELAKQLEQAQSERNRQEQEFQKQIAQQRQRSEELAKQLEQERSEAKKEWATAGAALGRAVGETFGLLGSRPPSVLFVLTSGLARDIGARKRLIIPSGTNSVQLQLDLERQDEYKSYRAELRTADGDEVWSQDMLRARLTDRGQAVALTLPARVLAGGDYLLTLSGLTARGEFEAVGSYQFSVVKR